MNQNILITGATGTVGENLTSLFMTKTGWNIYILLHKKGINLSKKRRKKYSARLKLLRGDITKPNLGLNPNSYLLLAQKITHIFHCAASTRFDLPLEKARKINVTGTRNMVRFAKKCPKLEQFGFMSTVYVSGKRVGMIKENELEHKSGFVNTYEQSKYEAEIFLKRVKNLPMTIYRLSTIIGNHKTGEIRQFTAPHLAIRMMYLGLAPMLPGTKNFKTNFISDKYSAETIFNLFRNRFTAGGVFHIVEDNGFSLKEIIDSTYRELSRFDKSWAEKGYPKPSIVSKEVFDLFMDSVISANNPILRGSLKPLSFFSKQLLYQKKFDYRNVSSVLPGYKKDLPKTKDYYGKIIRYCLKSKWGRIIKHGKY